MADALEAYVHEVEGLVMYVLSVPKVIVLP